MFSLLHQYLINFSSLALPGIGVLKFVDTSAHLSVDGQIMPPRQEIRLVNDNVTETTPQLVGFLSERLDTNEMQTQTIFQNFLQTIKNTLAEKKIMGWENLGEFKSDDNGNITFTQSDALNIYHQPIDAKSTNINNPNKHDGYDDNKPNNVSTKEELEALTTTQKNNWWWIWAIIIAVLAFVIIAVKYARS